VVAHVPLAVLDVDERVDDKEQQEHSSKDVSLVERDDQAKENDHLVEVDEEGLLQLTEEPGELLLKVVPGGLLELLIPRDVLLVSQLVDYLLPPTVIECLLGVDEPGKN
jgi:hypothetical protein